MRMTLGVQVCGASWTEYGPNNEYLGEKYCFQVADRWVMGGCRHEHVSENPQPVCEFHLDAFLNLPPNDMLTCTACEELEEPLSHKCEVGVKEVEKPAWVEEPDPDVSVLYSAGSGTETDSVESGLRLAEND